VALAVSLLPVLGHALPAAAAPGRLAELGIRPREDWADGLPPRGLLAQERPEDVRFLLVHHTASPNSYVEADVRGLIRGFYAAHTGPDKGWPDVAYNFFIDRFGTMWEARAGSLVGPVMPDATGGSQGFAQLCCFIGDHQTEAPTEAARSSAIAILAALADTYAIDTTPGATTTFVSRGSNRWPAGSPVIATTIAGHRDMSQSVCPGDAAYDLVQNVFPADVTALRASRAAPAPTAAPGTAATSDAPSAGTSAATDPAAGSSAAGGGSDSEMAPLIAGVTGGLVGAGAAGLAAVALKRRRAGHASPAATGADRRDRPSGPPS